MVCNAKQIIAKMLVCYPKWSWKYQLLFIHFWRETSSSFHSQVSSEEVGELRGEDCSSEGMSDTHISRDREEQIQEGPFAHFFPFLEAPASWAEGMLFTQAFIKQGPSQKEPMLRGLAGVPWNRFFNRGSCWLLLFGMNQSWFCFTVLGHIVLKLSVLLVPHE